MCTAFVYKGKDTILGYNLDVDPEVWNYRIIKNKDYFSVGIKVGSTTYLTHGVNSYGHFNCLPYANAGKVNKITDKKALRIDLLCDRYIRNSYTHNDLHDIFENYEIVNAKNLDMHSLVYGNGEIVLIEPGYPVKRFEKYAVVSNFPLNAIPENDNSFYGKDRYEKAMKILDNADESFGIEDGLNLLYETKQEGQWATRVSFVYSHNENMIYYVTDNKFDEIKVHQLER